MLLRSLRNVISVSGQYRACHIPAKLIDNESSDLDIIFAELTKAHEPERSLTEPNAATDLDEFAPHLAPTFNLAAYANKSQTLQKFLDLGVDLYKIEKRKGLGQFVLQLDFERDCKDHLMFLNDIGVPPEEFGKFITKNPLIFKETVDDMQIRINYLQSKNFRPHMISRIVVVNPFWLMFSTQRIDRRLGYFQKNFSLSGSMVRLLTVRQPRLITYNMAHVERATFAIKEEMGFDKDEVKDLLIQKPKLFMMSKFNDLLNV